MADPSTSSNEALERVSPSSIYPSEVDRMREIVAPDKSYVTRVREHIGDDIDLKKEVLILVITTSVFGFAALLLGAGGLGAAIGGLCGLLLTLIVMFVVHWVFASGEMDKQLRGGLGQTFIALQDEKARNAEPKLAGQIVCLNTKPTWSVDSFDPHDDKKDSVKSVFEFNVTIWNDSAASTVVSGFKMQLVWEGVSYDADPLPLDGFFVDHPFLRSEPFARAYDIRPERLTPFPDDIEITNTNRKSGWLRFLVRDTPSKIEVNGVLHRDAKWTLFALDRKGQPHKIYDGTWDLPPCGPIAKREFKLY